MHAAQCMRHMLSLRLTPDRGFCLGVTTFRLSRKTVGCDTDTASAGASGVTVPAAPAPVYSEPSGTASTLVQQAVDGLATAVDCQLPLPLPLAAWFSLALITYVDLAGNTAALHLLMRIEAATGTCHGVRSTVYVPDAPLV